MMQRLWSGVIALAAAFAGMVVIPGMAGATPYPETMLPVDARHSYCYTADFTRGTDPNLGEAAMRELDVSTQMTVSFEGFDCRLVELRRPRVVDVWWWEIDLPAGGRGQWACQTLGPVGRCASANVIVDFAQVDVGVNDALDRQKTAVHEVGHSVGLDHHSPQAHDCAMVSGEIPSTDVKWRRYDPHDVGHINNHF